MYAGFWKRFFAFIIDWAILFALMLLLYIALGIFTFYLTDWQSDTGINSINVLTALFYLSSFAVPILYWSFFEASSYQATPGKMALGIKVCDENGNPLKFAQSLGRNLGKIISNLTFYIGYVMAGFTVKRQALHDKMSGCLVIDKTAKFEDLRPFPKASLWKIAAAVSAVLLPFFLVIALLAACIVFGIFYYINSISGLREGVKYLDELKSFQEIYKARNRVYAQDLDLLLSEDVSSDLELSKAKIQIMLSSKDKFLYRFMPEGVSASSKQHPHYTLTVCYSSSVKCIDKELSQFGSMDFTVASPEDCCGDIKEE